jgi:hypothetical protein
MPGILYNKKCRFPYGFYNFTQLPDIIYNTEFGTLPATYSYTFSSRFRFLVEEYILLLLWRVVSIPPRCQRGSRVGDWPSTDYCACRLFMPDAALFSGEAATSRARAHTAEMAAQVS